jgi:hypothetical protein
MGAWLRRCAVPAFRDRLALGALSDKALARSPNQNPKTWLMQPSHHRGAQPFAAAGSSRSAPRAALVLARAPPAQVDLPGRCLHEDPGLLHRRSPARHVRALKRFSEAQGFLAILELFPGSEVFHFVFEGFSGVRSHRLQLGSVGGQPRRRGAPARSARPGGRRSAGGARSSRRGAKVGGRARVERRISS